MSNEFLDTIITFRDLTTNEVLTEKVHYNLSDRNKMLSRLASYSNPALVGKFELVSIQFFRLFSKEVINSYNKEDLHKMSGYTERVKEMKISWNRVSKIDSILK